MNTIVLDGSQALKKVSESQERSRIVTFPFLEKDILDLQNAFTIPGVHVITVESVQKGRNLISQLLTSLDWYQDIAYLASSNSILYQKATNIITRIEQPLTNETIAQFFINDFYYDFLWIEATPDLLSEQWLASIEVQLTNFHIDYMIPVIIVLYA